MGLDIPPTGLQGLCAQGLATGSAGVVQAPALGGLTQPAMLMGHHQGAGVAMRSPAA